MTDWQLNAKRVFLTYPRCDIERRDVYNKLKQLGAIQVAVAREQHQDGSFHLHCLAEWPGACRTRNVRHFDINGHHPNIQGCRDFRAVLAYITKADSTPISDFSLENTSDYYERLMRASNEREFWEIAKSNPRVYILFHEKLEHIARKHFGGSKLEWKPRFTEWSDIPNRLSEWFNGVFGSSVDGRCVF